MSFEEARKVCKLRVAQSKDFACVQLVYGHAGEEISRLQMTSIPLSFLSSSSLFSLSLSGDGKTHYIQQQLAHSSASLTVSVNEAFTPLNAISKLRTLPLNQNNCAIFFNFTMLPPGVRRWVEDGGGKGVREVEGEDGGG